MNKHFFNALVYDIFNWGLNLTMVAFLWTQSKTFCVAITGLFVMRFAANFIYTRTLIQEQLETQMKIRTMLEAPVVQKMEEDEVFLDESEPPQTPTDNDKKVH